VCRGDLDFSKTKTSFELKEMLRAELGKYYGDGKISLSERCYAPGACTFGYSLALPEFVPDKPVEATYKLTGLPIWDEKGLGKTATVLLQTVVPQRSDGTDIPKELWVSTDTHSITVELVDASGHVMVKKTGSVSDLEFLANPVGARHPGAGRELFNIPLSSLSRKAVSLKLTYDPKGQPIKMKRRILLLISPPLG
jgi:hypothetical protein